MCPESSSLSFSSMPNQYFFKKTPLFRFKKIYLSTYLTDFKIHIFTKALSWEMKKYITLSLPYLKENRYSWSLLWICICEFPCSLKFICNPAALPQSFAGMHRIVKNLSHPTYAFSADVKQVDALPPYFSSHTTNKCTFHCLLSATVLEFLCYYLVISVLKIAPHHSFKSLSNVPVCKQTMICPMEYVYLGLSKKCCWPSAQC